MIYTLLALIFWWGLQRSYLWGKRKKVLEDCLFQSIQIKRECTALEKQLNLTDEEYERLAFLKNQVAFSERVLELTVNRIGRYL